MPSKSSKDKRKQQAPGKNAGRRTLDSLKPDEAQEVLVRLLKVHPDLLSEAEQTAKSLLHEVSYEDIAEEIEFAMSGLDYDDLNARAGSDEWGYVEPSEAAEEILAETVKPFLEDMQRRLELGLEADALEICKGLLLGCYRLSESQEGDVLGWSPDFPVEAASNALELWYRAADSPNNRKGGGTKRPSFPPDFLSMVPEWVLMIERLAKKKKK